jgi:hypothetical protein
MKINRPIQMALAFAAVVIALLLGIARYRTGGGEKPQGARSESVGTSTPPVDAASKSTKGQSRPTLADNLPDGSSIVDEGEASGRIVVISGTSRIEAANAQSTANGVEFRGPIRVENTDTGSVMQLAGESSRLWLEKHGGKVTTTGELSVSMPPK